MREVGGTERFGEPGLAGGLQTWEREEAMVSKSAWSSGIAQTHPFLLITRHRSTSQTQYYRMWTGRMTTMVSNDDGVASTDIDV